MTIPLLSILVFLITLAAILSGKLNRAVAALSGAVLMVTLGKIFKFYSEEMALVAIDYHTLGLLLGMMILVGITQSTGMFASLAVWAAQQSRGKLWRLFAMLCGISTLAALYLDNITALLLIAPVTILVAKLLNISAYPFLLGEVILSNVGSMATLVGNPPNILIASRANLPFDEFLTHSLPFAIVIWPVTLFLLSRLFKEELSVTPDGIAVLAKLKPKDFLKDPDAALRLQIVICLAIVVFISQDRFGASPALIAMAAAVAALIWIRPNFRGILELIDWEVLIMIASLFVVVGGLAASGVVQQLADLIAQNQHFPPVLLAILFLWLVAIFSALADNLPVTIALIPVIEGLGSDGLAMTPLWWAMVLGAGLGANGTLLGSTSNLLMTSLSAETAHPITPRLWIKKGLPVMLVSCTAASILFLLFYSRLSR